MVSGQNYGEQSNTKKVNYRVTAVKRGAEIVTSMSNKVEAQPPINIYIPNAFTPNNDGLNDYFGVVGNGIEKYTLKVFNQWGELLFESHDIHKKWDGTYQNSTVQPGVYVYDVYAKGYQGKSISTNGSIAIITNKNVL